MRKDQLTDQKARDYFRNNGTIPDPNNITIDDRELYQPKAQIKVPKSSAKSDPAAHRQTVESLMADYYALLDLVPELGSAIQRLKSVIESETMRFSLETQKLHRHIRLLNANEDATQLYNLDVPLPAPISKGVDYDGQVSLLSDESVTVTYSATVEPYIRNGRVTDYSPVNTFTLPLHYAVKSTGTASGITIKLDFLKQPVTKLDIEGSACIVEVIAEDSTGKQRRLAKKHLDRRVTLQLENVVTDTIWVRFIQYQPDSNYTIENLSLYGERYVGNGVYISHPIPTPFSGVVSLNLDTYQPAGTSLSLSAGKDRQITGSFAFDPDKHHNIDNSFDPETGTSWLSQTYRHSLVSGVNLKQPDWKPIQTTDRIYLNCKERTASASDYLVASGQGGEERKVMVFPRRTVGKSLKIIAGKNTWMYIPRTSLLRISSTLLQSLGLNPHDYWTSHLNLPSGGEVTISNPNGLIKDLAVKTVQSDAAYPDTYEMIDRGNMTFQGTLPPGVYQIFMYVDAIDPTALSSASAITLTGVTPDTLIDYPTDGRIQLNYQPLVQIPNIGFYHIDPIHRHKYCILHGNALVVPYLRRSQQYDIYHPEIDTAFLYNDQTNLDSFYDISYIEVDDPDTWSNYLFIKGEFNTHNRRNTPVIRNMDLQIMDDLLYK